MSTPPDVKESRPVFPFVEYALFFRLSTHGMLSRESDVQATSKAAASGLVTPAAALLERFCSQITLAGGPHQTIAVRAPYTGATPAGTVADLELAVQRVRAVQTEWSKRSFAGRARIFLRFHDRCWSARMTCWISSSGKPGRRGGTRSKRFWTQPPSRAITRGAPNGCCGRSGTKARFPC